MKRKKQHPIPKKAPTPDKKKAVKRPILRVTIKFLIICLIIATGIYISDSEGVFDPDNKNNHTIKKWDAFYDFTEEHNVDILLVGNSHLYTGINPKNLSSRLGANAFILASPGTHIGDTYFALKEALKETDPKIVVVETYGISDFNPYELTEGGLSDQFKSFSARKNLWIKFLSTPSLFATENYPYAWSNTLRNHDYLLTNYEQIEKNTSSRRRFSKKRGEDLYLGRYVRFTSGLKDSVLQMYEEKGAPVEGKEYDYNEYTEKYIENIVELCEEKNIKLVFLTLPMYHQHIANYKEWQERLNKLLSPTNKPWLNLQTSEYHETFGPESFENTYSNNQHMTYGGSLIATHELADFLKNEVDIKLPARSQNPEWRKLFYGEEGFFEHNTPNQNDKKNQILAEKVIMDSIKIKEILFVTNKTNKSIIAKIEKSQLANNQKPDSCLLNLTFEIEYKGRVQLTEVPVLYDRFHDNPDYYIFKQNLKPVNIIRIREGEFECR